MGAPESRPHLGTQLDADLEKLAREALDRYIQEFDLPDSTMESWQQPFIVARVIQQALLDARILPHAIPPDTFLPVVEDFFCKYGEINPEEVPLIFPSVWEKVRMPEGETRVSYAAKCARIGKWKADVGSSFQNERIRHDAQLLATTICYLESMNNGKAYLSTRIAAEILGKSNGYASLLLKKLLEAGVLKATMPANRRHARIYWYIPPEDRSQKCTQDLQELQVTQDQQDPKESACEKLQDRTPLFEQLAGDFTDDPHPEDVAVIRECHDVVKAWSKGDTRIDTVEVLRNAVRAPAKKGVRLSRLKQEITEWLEKFDDEWKEQRYRLP